MVGTLGSLGLRILSSIKLSNSLLENTVCDRTVDCYRSIEWGGIHLKIRKGLLPFPRKLLFEIPPHATMIKNEDVGNVGHVDYGAKKGFLSSISCSNLVSNQEVHSVKLQYKRAVTDDYISDYIKHIKIYLRDGGTMVTVTNNSDIRFIGHIVKCKLPLPGIRIQRGSIKVGTIKVYNNAGEKIENFVENTTENWEFDSHSSEMKSLYYGDVCWYIDSLNPHDLQTFKIDYSEDKGDGYAQEMNQPVNRQKDSSRNNAETDKPSKKEEQPEPTRIPHLSNLESEIYGIFKSVYQKEREEGVSEVNSKTLELLKSKLLDLTESGEEINWLDVGCGDGRCLEVLDAIQNRKKIRYHGIDSLHRYLDAAEERARGYGIIATFDKTNAAAMDFDSEYDVVSAVLLLHEVDPLCLPYVLRNMIKALKDGETLVISDFQGPYEQECDVVAWNVEDITHLLEKIGVAWIKTEFIQSKQYPEELGFYRCHIKKPQLVDGGFDELLQGYGDFLTAKKKESKRERSNLRVQIEERVQKLLNRPDIDLKNLSEEEMQRIRTEIEPEYGIKAYKIHLLVSQIEFLDDKIEEFNSGARCVGADQHVS